MLRKIALLFVTNLCLVAAGTALGQMHYQPQPQPRVTAENEPWFQLGQPIVVDGITYYQAGARVFFDGNVMVRVNAYRGIPVYANATLEAHSKVFVPLTGGLMQPYERRRTGDLAGSTGTQAPSFPVSIAGEPTREPEVTPSLPANAAPPTISAGPSTGRSAVGTAGRPSTERDSRGAAGLTTDTTTSTPPPRDVLQLGARPRGLNEVFVNYQGFRWRAAGRAVSFDGSRFEQIGTYKGFPVYATRGDERGRRRIFLPSRSGLVAPYERAGRPIYH